MANVLVQIISRADNSGFASAGRSLAKFSAIAGAASSGAASAAGAVAALGTAAAGVGVLALPALGVVMAGLDGIKEAAGAAQPALDRFKSAMSGEFARGMTGGFEKLGGVLDAIQPQMQGVARAVSGLFDGFAETVARNTTGLQAIGDKAAEFVTRLGPGLDTLITKLIQFGASINVDSIFQVFSTLGEVLGPLANLFVQLAAAAGPFGSVLSVLGGIITAITPALVNMASQVGPQISAAFTTLSPAIVQVAEAFSQVIVAIAPALPVIASLVAALVDGLGPALPAIIGGMIAFAAVAKGLVILSAVAGFIKTMAVALRIVTVAQWLWNAALLANPLTWVVIAVVALIAVIVLIATKTTWFQTIWSAMVTAAVAVWNFIVAAVQAFVGVFMGVMTAIASFAVAAWNMILAAAAAVWNAIVAVVSAVGAAIGAVISAAGAVVSAVWNAILAAASAAWNAVTAVVSAVASAIGSVIGGVVDVVVGLWERVSSVGSSAFSAVSSAASAVGDAISTVIGFVQSLISAISNISFPSPPGWMTSLFGATLSPAIPGAAAYMAPAWNVQNPRVLQLAGGYPSLSDLGGLRTGGTVVQQIDQSVNVKVDGSGIVDPQRVAESVTGAIGRNNRTRGVVPAMRLGV